ncbi:MAG: SGNH/GDSL hydrolase family protein [Sphingomonas sp.]|uniref:SGNH/GDSL hydrolase family protein n=1 Tax=Sphingomonas sp. TaxID=28214 RepID=UPI0022734D1C|nr:SGNH/GDSL hydrolase family protein [Sphingomonas sp.]MCX8476223.1 SGNH/GDSL hydrolase family protein [Sphingomonas sp.]
MATLWNIRNQELIEPRALSAALAAAMLTLASCSGGGASGSMVTPKPTPVPTASPTIQIMGEARIMSATTLVALLNPVSQVSAVYSYGDQGQRIDYQQGTDWIVSGNSIARTAGSRIPNFANYTYTKTNGDKFDFAGDPRNPPLTIGYNIYVDYSSTAPDLTVKATPLAKRNGTVLCAGDSIAHGAHTVASYYHNSDWQGWCGMLRKNLQGQASVVNASIPGSVLQSFSSNIDSWLASDPDTIILAFGMNDHVNGAAYLPTFTQHLNTVLDRLGAENVQVVLVGFFQQNERWNMEDPSQTIAYNNAIRTAAQVRGLPFVDPYAAFGKAVAGSEQFYHLTADFMHHPNIYGQRIYYSLIIPYFLDRDMPSSAVPDYVLGNW